MKKLWTLMICLAILAFSGNVYALSVTTTASGDDLVNNILGTGITVVSGSISYNGAAGASGTFTDGISSGLGIEGNPINEGIILTSGTASLAPGPNTLDNATGNNGMPGDPALTALAGYPTYDATTLSFDFETDTGDLYFDYVFASEEYNEYTNTQYNDVFAFFLDGINIALIPGTTTPVSVNNVNGGNPYGTAASHPEYYHNNDLNDGGPFYDIEYDGFTHAFTAQALGIGAGTHTITLAIADSGDHILDSAVFIEAGTFSGTPDPVPEPSTILLVGTGLLGIIGFGRKRFNKKA